jgi:hypothetical protein
MHTNIPITPLKEIIKNFLDNNTEENIKYEIISLTNPVTEEN